MVKNIVVVGAGGHCRIVLSILRHSENFKVVGIADRSSDTIGEEILGSRIEYTWDDFEDLQKKGVHHAFIAIGDNEERKNLFETLSKIGFKIPTLIHPSALIEKDAVLGTVIKSFKTLGKGIAHQFGHAKKLPGSSGKQVKQRLKHMGQSALTSAKKSKAAAVTFDPSKR